MLEYLAEQIEWIIDFFQSIGSFIMNMIEGLLDLLTMIPAVVNMFTSGISYLPNVCVAFATTALTVAIIYLTIGRGHDG